MQNNELKKVVINIQQGLIKQARNSNGFDKAELNKKIKTMLSAHIFKHLKDQGISGHATLLNTMNLLDNNLFLHKDINDLVKGHELSMFIESLKKLGVPEKDCMQRIQDIKDSVSTLVTNVEACSEELIKQNKLEESKKLSEIEKSKRLKEVISKIALGTVIVIGAIAALIGLAALAIATGVAPAILVTAAAGIGVTAATSVTMGGVTLGLAGMAGTVAATGAVTTTIASVGVGKAMKAIEASDQKSKDQTHIEIDIKLAKELTDSIEKLSDACELTSKTAKQFVESKAIAQRG